MYVWLKKLIFCLLLASVVASGMLACGGGGGAGEGNPAAPTPPVPVFGDFVLAVATSSNDTANSFSPAFKNSIRSNSISLQSGGILLEETRNVVTDISFIPVNGSMEEIQYPGMYVVELVTGGNTVNQVFPSFGLTRLPFTEYREFEMKFEKIEEGEIPPELLEDPLSAQFLVDQTLVIEGSFLEAADNDINNNNRQDYIPFMIISDKDVNIRVTSPNAFTVSQTQINYFFIAFEVDSWFSNLLGLMQEASGDELSDGVLVVSDQNSNDIIHEILDQFESNLEGSCRSAPSDDGEFEEEDVDEDSSSSTF